MAGIAGEQSSLGAIRASSLTAPSLRGLLHRLRLPLLLGLGFALLVLLPFLAGALGAPPGAVFLGSLKALGDEGVYLAAIREGGQGAWLWHDPFMVHPPAAILMYPTYMVTGHLGGLLDLPVRASYALMHGIAALLLFGAVWNLGVPYVEQRDRPWFTAFALGMSGLYWLDALLSAAGHAPASLVWIAVPQLGGLTSAIMGAHETLGVAGQLAMFAGLLGTLRTGEAAKQWGYVLYGGAGTLLVGLTLPILLPLTVAVSVLFVSWWAFSNFGPPEDLDHAKGVGDRGALLRTALLQVGLICLPGLLAAAYYYWQLTFGPWSGSPLRFDGSRPVVETLLTWIAPLPLGVWGWRVAPSAARPLATLLALWCCCAVVGSQLPLWQSFRFSTGLNVMTGALFALGLLRPRIGRRWRVRWLLIVSLGAVTHLLFLLSVLIPGNASHLYGTVGQDRAFQWLATHCTTDEVVLAPIGFSNGLPSWAPCRTVFGHIFLTFDTTLRESQVQTFYGDGETAAVRLAALRATGANMVVYDSEDSEDGSFDPRGLPGLQQVYAEGGFAILRVTGTH